MNALLLAALIAVGPPETLHSGFPLPTVDGPLVVSAPNGVYSWLEKDRLFIGTRTKAIGLDRQPLLSPATLVVTEDTVFAVWAFRVANGATAMVRRFTPELQPIDERALVVGTVTLNGSLAAPMLAPSAAWNGRELLIAFHELIARVPPRGGAASAQSLEPGSRLWWMETAIASNGSTAMIAAHTVYDCVGFGILHCPPVTRGGSSLTVFSLVNSAMRWPLLPQTQELRRSLSIAASGSRFLTAWKEGAWLYAAAIPAGELPQAPRRVAALAGIEAGIVVLAPDGDDWLIAWEDANAIHAAMLDRDGNVIVAPVRVTDETGRATSPSLVRSGTGFALTYAVVAGLEISIRSRIIATRAPGRVRSVR